MFLTEDELTFNARVTFSYAEGHGDNSISTRYTIQTANEIRQVVKHRQVVLHYNDVLIGGYQTTNGLSSFQTLFYIKVTRRLIKHETKKKKENHKPTYFSSTFKHLRSNTIRTFSCKNPSMNPAMI